MFFDVPNGRFYVCGVEVRADKRYSNHYSIALQNAFQQLRTARTFYEGIFNTVRLGGDCDTNAAIAGALLGAKFGFTDIPSYWIDAVKNAKPVRISKFCLRRNLDLSIMDPKNIQTVTENIFTPR